MLKNIEDVIKRSSNKIDINIVSEIDEGYELYGHVKLIISILQYFVSYLYNKIISQNVESNIDILSKINDGKLKIHTKIEGKEMPVEQIKKEYKNHVHKALLIDARSKLELKTYDNTIEIIYLFDLLTKEEKRKFKVDYLDYEVLYNSDDSIIKN